MEFCIISPIAGLEKFARLSRRHLVLAQLGYNNEYLRWYATRKQAGDFIILDNGAYEGMRPALDDQAYLNMIDNFSPNVTVLPDLLMHPWRESASRSLNFLDALAHWRTTRRPATEWMFVPQSEATDANGWYKAMTLALNDARVGHLIKWIGLPRALVHHYGEPNLRVRMARAISSNLDLQHVKLHALGWGGLEELEQLKDAGVESIDTSAPVWRGWNGLHIAEDERWKELGSPCNFFESWPNNPDDERQIQRYILKNLEAVHVDISSAGL